MTAQEKSLKIVATLELSSAKVALILDISRQAVDKKKKQENGNKFTDDDFKKLSDFVNQKEKEIKKLKELMLYTPLTK